LLKLIRSHCLVQLLLVVVGLVMHSRLWQRQGLLLLLLGGPQLQCFILHACLLPLLLHLQQLRLQLLHLLLHVIRQYCLVLLLLLLLMRMVVRLVAHSRLWQRQRLGLLLAVVLHGRLWQRLLLLLLVGVVLHGRLWQRLGLLLLQLLAVGHLV
jgi:hypothetical protein